MEHLFYWKKDQFSEKKLVQLSEEDGLLIASIREWWNEIGEAILNEHYGVARVEEDGDLVIKDIDKFMEANDEDTLKTEDDDEEYTHKIKPQTEDIDIDKVMEENENMDEDIEEEKDSFLYDDEDEDGDDDDDTDAGFY